jgi:uncharacterized protein YbaR (Trm112 family)/2-polyprenyl-3-methyl-5-hydroxy-6-metoxy-1,4-benzoquinol methylase
MFRREDLAYLCCPVCKGSLTAVDGSSGIAALRCKRCSHDYPVTNGIPRLLPPKLSRVYNANWDYKWFTLDGGKGYNYRMIDKRDPAYKAHNVFRFFEEEGSLFERSKQHELAVDVGCGTGQYSISLLESGAVKRVIAMDLTRGVDVGAELVRKKYAKYADRIVFVQADARALPVKSAVSDMSMALASIHHSGDIESCLRELVRVTKPGRNFGVWIYTTPTIEPVGDKYRTFFGYCKLLAHLAYLAQLELVYNILRRVPNGVLMPVLRVMASDTVYRLRHVPVLGALVRFMFPAVCDHPNKGYRLINLYDGYSPGFSDHFTEFDVFRWSKTMNFKVENFVPHRLGWIGVKR